MTLKNLNYANKTTKAWKLDYNKTYINKNAYNKIIEQV